MSTAPVVVPRRERARAATIEEIKATALDLMREQHTTDVRFTDIARVMGMTPPALYRYFADRDELLTELITDAYDDLGARVAHSRDEVAESDIGGRWLAAAQAYRS
jgi:AcrR family transcriptional regulator